MPRSGSSWGPPPWWPEGEAWPPSDEGGGSWGPPAGWGRGRRGGWGPGGRAGWGPRSGGWAGPRWSRRGFFWRMGIAFGAFVFLVLGAVTLAIVLVGGLLGLVGLSADVRLAALVVLALGVTGIVAAARSFGRAAAPLGDLIEAAGRVEAGDLSTRVEERGPREVRTLARAFNAMGARLEADEASRRTLLADITHELRTPLTVIQGNLEGLIDGVYPADRDHLDAILEETRTLGRLIDDLRTLALADRGALDLKLEAVDALVLANESVASFRAAADGARVSITVSSSRGDLPLVQADPTRIREVLGNLLSNALQHTPAGGQIAVALETPAGGANVSVAVSDTGPGIADDVLGRVFDRFVRAPDSRGSGLGLAIARDLVEAQGGTIEAANRPEGGAVIRFTLPTTGGR
jgi:signal transduction histidine kinase